MNSKIYNLLDIANIIFWYLINAIAIILNKSSNYRIDLGFKTCINIFIENKKF